MRNALTIARNNKMYNAVIAAKNVLLYLQCGMTVEETVAMINDETENFTWSQDVVFMSVFSEYGLFQRVDGTLYNCGFIPATKDAMSMAHKVPLTKKKFPIKWGTYYQDEEYEDVWGIDYMSLH